MRNSRKAFTIVELVIVIAVIAILAGVLIPTFSGIIKKAEHNVDVQATATMNTALAMYSGDGKIRTESDVRNAINEVMGAGYYEKLTPNSASQGYHFWYNIAENKVIVNTVEEVQALSRARAATPDVAWTDSDNNLRNFNGYFLMDRGGSKLGDALAKLDSSYSDAVTALADVDAKDKAFADAAATKLATTAVVNSNGTFVKDASAVVNYVYFSLTATELVGTDMRINNAEALTMTLPSNITKLNSYSLAFNTESKMYVDATEEEFAQMSSAYSVENCEIILSGTPGYFVGDAGLQKPDGTTTDLDVSESSVVTDMTLSATANKDNKIELVRESDGSYKLYVAVDYSDAITLDVLDYLNSKDEKIVARGTTWAVASGSIAYADGAFKVTGFADNAEALAGTITAKVQDVTKTVKVYGVKALNVKVDTSDNEGLDIKDVDATNVTITLPYDPKVESHFNFKPSLVLNYTGTSVELDGEIKVEAGAMEFNNDVLSLPANTFSDNAVTQLTVSYGEINSDITYTLNLINNSDKSFKINKNYVTTQTYASLTDYSVGNAGAFKLSYLFESVKDTEGQTIVVEIYDGTSRIGGSEYASLNDTITLSDDALKSALGKKLTIKISVKNSAAKEELPIRYVAATNITKDTAVADIPSSSSANIVLLSDISLTAKKLFNNVYGNLHTIDATAFNESGTTYRDQMIKLYGTMDNIVLKGPVYPTINVNGSGSYGCDGVSLVSASSKISNSYLSGFRAPVAIGADGSDVTIENSVIEGGTYANIFAMASNSLTLNNVSTIQARSGYAVTGNTSKKIIGMGIFCDTSYGGTIIMKGNTTQYNWVCKEDMNNYDPAAFYEVKIFGQTISLGIKQVIEYMVDNGSAYHHTINDGGTNKKFVNTGIIQEYDKTKTTSLSTPEGEYTGSLSYTTKQSVELKIIIKLKDYNVYGIASCGTTPCEHKWLPSDYDNNGQYGVDEYLHARAN